MRPDPQFPSDLVTFTGEILNGKLYFLCSDHPFSTYCKTFQKNNFSDPLICTP